MTLRYWPLALRPDSPAENDPTAITSPSCRCACGGRLSVVETPSARRCGRASCCICVSCSSELNCASCAMNLAVRPAAASDPDAQAAWSAAAGTRRGRARRSCFAWFSTRRCRAGRRAGSRVITVLLLCADSRVPRHGAVASSSICLLLLALPRRAPTRACACRASVRAPRSRWRVVTHARRAGAHVALACRDAACAHASARARSRTIQDRYHCDLRPRRRRCAIVARAARARRGMRGSRASPRHVLRGAQVQRRPVRVRARALVVLAAPQLERRLRAETEWPHRSRAPRELTPRASGKPHKRVGVLAEERVDRVAAARAPRRCADCCRRRRRRR